MKKYTRGFTFIEMMIGMVVIGVVGAMSIPTYVDASQQKKDDSLWQHSVAVKDAHDTLLERGSVPSVADLAAHLPGRIAAVAGGVKVEFSGVSYVVPTYTNGMCTIPTKSVDEAVGCVGAIAS
ncbi:MAG: type II secretion system protein [Ectothiorhodospiraceae bacterium]|nr:type II secretion system protein [Ectothiorhodospiraceae bacterium]